MESMSKCEAGTCRSVRRCAVGECAYDDPATDSEGWSKDPNHWANKEPAAASETPRTQEVYNNSPGVQRKTSVSEAGQFRMLAQQLERELSAARQENTELNRAIKSWKLEEGSWQRQLADLRAQIELDTGNIQRMQEARARDQVMLAELREQLAEAPKDAERLAYVYSKNETDSNALVKLEIEILAGNYPNIEEIRAAIDAAIKESKP